MCLSVSQSTEMMPLGSSSLRQVSLILVAESRVIFCMRLVFVCHVSGGEHLCGLRPCLLQCLSLNPWFQNFNMKAVNSCSKKKKEYFFATSQIEGHLSDNRFPKACCVERKVPVPCQLTPARSFSERRGEASCEFAAGITSSYSPSLPPPELVFPSIVLIGNNKTK